MILIELFPDRSRVGRLIVQDDSGDTLLGPFAALGKADDNAAKANGNPSRDPLHVFGDTPLGSYQCHVQPPQTPVHSYGPYKTIALVATGGDALTAQKNGRSGLLIHGGDLGPNGSLRPTHGCVRLFNEDMKLLTDLLTTQVQLGWHGTIKYEQSLPSVGAPHEANLFASSSEQLNDTVYPRQEAPILVPKPGMTGAAAIAPIPQFSIDTDLITTSSVLTKEIITAFFESQPAIHRTLADIAEPVIAASTTYGVNATYIVAHAIWETGWGTSTICRLKNNLFGYTAYDNSPLESATKFASRAECIEYVIPLIDKNYLQPTGRYFVRKACVGNKSYGMNVHYASDTTWGAGIASVARDIERFARRMTG